MAKHMSYDSTADTLKHIRRVNELLLRASTLLLERARVHDESKLHSPEKEAFDRETPLLRELKYGTPEYTESLKRLEEALDHHYANNSHHPQHYPNGVDGMDLIDLVEMFFDWVAATERTSEGSIYKSIQVNRERFQLSDQLVSIMENTARNLEIK